jgi:hypothetical protein
VHLCGVSADDVLVMSLWSLLLICSNCLGADSYCKHSCCASAVTITAWPWAVTVRASPKQVRPQSLIFGPGGITTGATNDMQPVEFALRHKAPLNTSEDLIICSGENVFWLPMLAVWKRQRAGWQKAIPRRRVALC